MPTKRTASVLSLAVLIVSAMAWRANAQKTQRITGTYSSMYYNKEGGDVLGTERKFVCTQKGYQGALQFAEGAPEPLIIVDIKVDGINVSFPLPGGSFNGVIVNDVLTGEFQFNGAAQKK